MTSAFTAAAHGKMKLSKSDYYQGDESKAPCLELEYCSDSETRTVVSDDTRGDISKTFTIFSINNPVYAKATGRNMGKYASHSAELYIQDIEVCTIPEKSELSYKFAVIKRQFGKSSPNLSDFFSSSDGLEFIINYKQEINKCISQTRIQNLLHGVTSENASSFVEPLEAQPTVKCLLDELTIRYTLTAEDAIKYFIQILAIYKEAGFDLIQNSFSWLTYKKRKAIVDERLSEFNTTGLALRSAKRGNKLTISFGRAGRMSNGERDVLSFIASLVAFESTMSKKPAILIMDEVFDYLDGTNLLAAQHYLSCMIEKIKSDDKTVFPIIMTHLDPAVFANYCFKKMAVHYLTNKSVIDLTNNIVKLLLLRGDMQSAKDPELGNLEKHLLHYHPDNWTIPEVVKGRLPDDFWSDSESFREYVYSEVMDRYLKNLDYNAPAVIIGLRIKVEEKTAALIPRDKLEEYFSKHGSKKKLAYAEECDCDLPELFYLLQPLYNDSAHLRSTGSGHEQETRNKIESAYLKTSSKIIKKMINEVFM